MFGRVCGDIGMYGGFVMPAAGFVLLIAGADLLARGASSLARRINVSDLVIGLTVVALGTSATELSVTTVARLQGSTSIALGNVLGSTIANVLLVLGVASVIYSLSVSTGTACKDPPSPFWRGLSSGSSPTTPYSKARPWSD